MNTDKDVLSTCTQSGDRLVCAVVIPMTKVGEIAKEAARPIGVNVDANGNLIATGGIGCTLGSALEDVGKSIYNAFFVKK